MMEWALVRRRPFGGERAFSHAHPVFRFFITWRGFVVLVCWGRGGGEWRERGGDGTPC